MVKIKVRASKQDVEQAEAGDFGDPPPPDMYHLKLAGIEKKTTKGTDDRYYLNCRWQPVGVGREGKKLEQRLGSVWDTVSLTSEEAGFARARLALALGAKPNRAGNVDLDLELDPKKPGNPIGTVVLGRVQSDSDLNGNYRPKLGWIGPIEGSPEDSEAFDDDEGEEEEASEPFDDEEEVEEGELLTEEQLEEKDNKELGAIAKDFDLNSKDFVVKGRGGKPDLKKSRKALIDGILEAQGDFSPEEEEEDDDDNPF